MEDNVPHVKVFAANPAGTIQGMYMIETNKNDLEQKNKSSLSAPEDTIVKFPIVLFIEQS